MTALRCLTCLRVDGCPEWCLSATRTPLTATRIMPAVEGVNEAPENAAEPIAPRPAWPVRSTTLVGLGLILGGLALIALGITRHLAEGGVMVTQFWAL